MESIISKQKLVNEEARILRQCKGRSLSIQRRVFCMSQEPNNRTHFYVGSESVTDRYYFVELKSIGDSSFCTCWDYASNRSEKCKHIYAVQYAIHLGLVQTVDHKLPISQKPVTTIPEHYKNLSIATLNELEKAEIEETEVYRNKRQQSWTEDEYSF